MNTLFTITEDYLEYCKTQRRLDWKTLKAYRTDLNQFVSIFNIPDSGLYPCLLRLPLSLPPILINPLSPAFLSFQYLPHTYPFHPDTVS